MSPGEAVSWRHGVDELANALQVAVGPAMQVRRNAQTTADDAVLLEGSIARAVTALNSLLPSPTRRRRNKR